MKRKWLYSLDPGFDRATLLSMTGRDIPTVADYFAEAARRNAGGGGAPKNHRQKCKSTDVSDEIKRGNRRPATPHPSITPAPVLTFLAMVGKSPLLVLTFLAMVGARRRNVKAPLRRLAFPVSLVRPLSLPHAGSRPPRVPLRRSRLAAFLHAGVRPGRCCLPGLHPPARPAWGPKPAA